jgi:hypothetical protein
MNCHPRCWDFGECTYLPDVYIAPIIRVLPKSCETCRVKFFSATHRFFKFTNVGIIHVCQSCNSRNSNGK